MPGTNLPMNWLRSAQAAGDEALRDYVDQLPEEDRQRLLADPDVAEVYARAPKQDPRPPESE
jgi:hypothetical protein